MVSKKRAIIAILGCFIACILFLYIYRASAHTEIDDVTPGEDIPCDRALLEKIDVLYVIPSFNNKSIANQTAWCSSILALNKTLGLHGVHHYYHEFGTPLDPAYLQEGIDDFTACFGYAPRYFKAPFLDLAPENRNLVKAAGLTLQGMPNQIFHKVYHCGGEGWTSSRLQDLF